MNNLKTVELNYETVIEKLDSVYNDLPSSAWINISIEFVLFNVRNSEEFSYYYTADKKPHFSESYGSLQWHKSHFYQIEIEKWRFST